MKNTRKKMLLSSIAMLLVALIALGSATYAWFVANPDASAQGISLKTTAAAGLVCRTDSDSVWDHDAALDNGGTTFNLQPVSQDASDTSKFYTVEALGAGDEAADTDKEMGNADIGGYLTAQSDTRTTGDLYKENIYFRLSDGSNATDATSKKVYLKGVSITKNTSADANMDGTIRVAVVDNTGALLGTYSNGNHTANPTRLNPVSDSNKKPGKPSNYTVTTGANLNVDTGLDNLPATANTTKYVTVYVYMDGQDGNCYSDKVGTQNAAEIISSIKLDFALA